MDALPSFNLNDVEKKANESIKDRSMDEEVRVVYRPFHSWPYAVYVGDNIVKLYSTKFFAIRKAKDIARLRLDKVGYTDYTVWSSKR